MSKYNNGNVIDINDLPSSEYENAAKEWAEGSKSLENLLLYLLNNNIKTQGCCIGHKDSDDSYISFEFSEKNLETIISLISNYYNSKNIHLDFTKKVDSYSNFVIRVPKSIGEAFFADMLSYLKEKKKVNLDSLPSFMIYSIDIMLKHKIPDEYLEIQYSKDDDKRNLFFATNDYFYADAYFDNPKMKSWVENSVSIVDTPDNMTPVLKEVSKRIESKYSNYIQGGFENYYNSIASRNNNENEDDVKFEVACPPGMRITEIAKLLAGTKQFTTVNGFKIDGSKYNSPEELVRDYYTNLMKIKELRSQGKDKDIEFIYNDSMFLNNSSNLDNEEKIENSTPFTFNYNATMENDYARKNSIQVVEILPGNDIISIARAIAGQRYITNFNGFTIDGTKYSLPEKIVEDYYMYLMKMQEMRLQEDNYKTEEETTEKGISR